MTIQPLARPVLGVAYYPEHWPESRWAEDAKVLREAGITVVRLLEFAWDQLEPHPGEFEHAWLDRALSIFEEAGIKVVLGTPTAAPPPWLSSAHPDILRVDERTGLRLVPGSRRFACPNAPAYQEATDRIVKAIAARWGKHSNVIGWQIDNEFGGRCVCDYCRAEFQAWLKQRYGTLDDLNAAWGSKFWSATYTEWEQIPAPAPTSAHHNPGLLLDYRRFYSDAWAAYQRRQIDLLRANSTKNRFITHNFMLKFTELDYFALGHDLDLISFDNYPHGMSGPLETAFNLDLMRGLKDRSFWIMEMQTGNVNWTPFNPPVPPGQVRTWTHQVLAHGAEAVVYFRERAVNIGQEQYHAGLLKHDGTPDRGWHEVKAVSEDLEQRPVLHRPKAKIALMFDYQDLWTLELDPHNRAFSYYQLVLDIYGQLWDANVPVDFIPRSAALSVLTGYDAVVVPAPALIDEKQAGVWRQYVEKGGKLVVTFRAFFKNPGNTWTDQPAPAGGLGDLLGVKVDEFISIPPIPAVGIRSPNEDRSDWTDERGVQTIEMPSALRSEGFGLPMPTKARYHTWAEVLTLTTASPLLRYADGYYKDGIAAAVNNVGKGAAYTIGCWGELIIPRSIWHALDLQHYGVTAEHDAHNGAIEIVKLEDESGQTVELRINHGRRTVALPEGAR